jgi:hypothetical protein
MSATTPERLFSGLCAESFEVPPKGSGPRGSARFAQRGWPKFGWNLCMRCSTSPQTKRHVSVKQGMRETEQWLTKAAHPNSFHLTGELRKRGVRGRESRPHGEAVSGS